MFGIPHFQRLDNCSITWRGVVVDVLANTDTLEQEGRRLAAACLYLEDHGIKPDHANLTQLWRRIALAMDMPTPKYVLLWAAALDAHIPVRVIPVHTSDLAVFSNTLNELLEDFREINGAHGYTHPFCRTFTVGTQEGLAKAFQTLESDVRWYSHQIPADQLERLNDRHRHIIKFAQEQINTSSLRLGVLPTLEESHAFLLQPYLKRLPILTQPELQMQDQLDGRLEESALENVQ